MQLSPATGPDTRLVHWIGKAFKVTPDKIGIAVSGGGVLFLNQQPVFATLVAGFLPLHPHEVPATGQALAVQTEMQMALLQSFFDRLHRLPVPDVEQHDRAGTVIVLGDRAFEAEI